MLLYRVHVINQNSWMQEIAGCGKFVPSVVVKCRNSVTEWQLPCPSIGHTVRLTLSDCHFVILPVCVCLSVYTDDLMSYFEFMIIVFFIIVLILQALKAGSFTMKPPQ